MVYDPTDSRRPWKCDFADCTQRFKSEERLKKHKRDNDDHDYCHYCDSSFEDWDALTAHKTDKASDEIRTIKDWEKRELRREMMLRNGESLTSIEYKREADPKPSFTHLCCKFCGMDFGSVAGRDTHINQQHHVDQELPCPGCGLIFPRAAALIYHLEFNDCPKISHDRFAGYLQHKAIVNRLLANPELIGELERNNYIDAAKDTDESGGVKLGMLDDIGGNDALGVPLEPDKPNTAGKIPGKQQAWPKLTAVNPPSKPLDLLSDFETMSITSESTKSKPKKVIAHPFPLCEDPTAFLAQANSSTPVPANPWSTNTTSKTLFPNAKPTPLTADWQAVIEAQSASDHRSNILQYQFWNPTHRDYNPEGFYNPMLEEYHCPFPACGRGVKTPWELETHINSTHKIDRIRCPQCLKLFKSHTALISHCESVNSRCRLNRTERFGQIMDEFSGGFLSARRERRPDCDERDGTRIEFVKFGSCVPEDLRRELGRELGREERVKMVTGGVDMRVALGVGLGERVDDRSSEERAVDEKKREAIEWFE